MKISSKQAVVLKITSSQSCLGIWGSLLIPDAVVSLADVSAHSDDGGILFSVVYFLFSSLLLSF